VWCKRSSCIVMLVTSMTLWCPNVGRPPEGGNVVYWSQFVGARNQTSFSVSLPEIVHKEPQYWKERYTSWLGTIVAGPCGSLSIEQVLALNPGFSYWWMTVPTEFSFGSSSVAYSTIRAWALVELIEGAGIGELVVVGASKNLKKVLTSWSKESSTKVKFFADPGKNKSYRYVIRRLRPLASASFPSWLVGVLHICNEYAAYAFLRRREPKRGAKNNSDIIIVDYFSNFDPDAASDGTYESQYWGTLPSLISEMGFTIRWIHVDLRSAAAPTISSARRSIRSLEKNSESGSHDLIQQHLSAGVALRAASQFFSIRKVGRLVEPNLQWKDTVTGLNAAPFFQSRVRSDFFGRNAASNALWLCLFDRALECVESDSAPCIYLYEGQAWELALLNARAKRRSGLNVGVAHVPVRNWDLRYALNMAGKRGVAKPSAPIPDIVGVIDSGSREVLISNGVEDNRIVSVSALRFLTKGSTESKASLGDQRRSIPLRVLVVGEYESELLRNQIEVAKELSLLGRYRYELLLRPHPGRVLSRHSSNSGIPLSRAHTLEEALSDCDVVICGDVSSAAIDASIRKIPVVMFQDGRGLRGSPLLESTTLVQTANTVEADFALSRFAEDGWPTATGDGFHMHLDPTLGMWRNLLRKLSHAENGR